MSDEAVFYRTFMEDVRACAGARGGAYVLEIDHRIRLALSSSPRHRDARWARVVAAVTKLLTALDRNVPAAARLHAFVHENADLVLSLHPKRRVRIARRVARF